MSVTENEMMIQGAKVFDRDGERIGAAADPGGAYFMIEEGTLIIKSFYLPKRTIAQVNEEGIRLRISKAEAEAMGRKEPPDNEDPWLIEPTPDEPAATR